MKPISLGPFLGPTTSLDARAIDPTNAASACNYMYEDGALRVRYGYRNLLAAQASFSLSRGFVWCQGYNSSFAEVEEYLSFEKVSGNVRCYSILPGSPYTRTEVKNGTTSVNLNDSLWQVVLWQGKAYLVNRNSTPTVYRHTLGDNTSLVPLQPPTAPSNAPTWSLSVPPYTSRDWGSIANANVTKTGLATSATVTNGQLVISHTAGQTGAASAEVDLTVLQAGGYDWSSVDDIQCDFITNTVMQIVVKAVSVYNGTTWFTLKLNYDIAISTNTTLRYTMWALEPKTRSSWGPSTKITKIKFEYDIIAAASTSSMAKLTISAMTLGGVNLVPISTAAKWIEFAYCYYNSSINLRSGISPALTIPWSSLVKYGASANFQMGAKLAVNWTASGDGNVTHVVLFVRRKDSDNEPWKLFATTAIGTTTVSYAITQTELDALAADDVNANPFDRITCACPYKGFMAYGKTGGYQNIQLSRVNNPELFENGTETDDDENRGRTMTMAANAADDPVCLIECGDALVACGSQGVYASTGEIPRYMTYWRRLSGSKGVAGPLAACRWRTDGGGPCAVVLSNDGDVLMHVMSVSWASGDTEPPIDLTFPIRGEVKRFLADEQTLSLANASVSVDSWTDSLWIVLGSRAMVLRKPNLVDGARKWEYYKYAHAVAFVAQSSERRMRWIRSSGAIDEVEWNSSINAWIEGRNRDAGSPVPVGEIWWESKIFTGPNSKLGEALVIRDDLQDSVVLKVVSTRQTRTVVVRPGSLRALFGPFQQGWDHQVRIETDEGSAPIRAVSIAMGKMGRRLLA